MESFENEFMKRDVWITSRNMVTNLKKLIYYTKFKYE